MAEEMPDFLKKMFEHMHMVEISLGAEKGSWVNVQAFIGRRDEKKGTRFQTSQGMVQGQSALEQNAGDHGRHAGRPGRILGRYLLGLQPSGELAL